MIDDDDPRASNFRFAISIAIEYQRRRTTVAGKWEGPLITTVLLVAGVAFVFLVAWQVFRLF